MSAVVYFKTDAGREEIQQRTLKLPAALRSLLVMIDGQRSAADLGDVIASLRLPGDALEQLLAQGLIAAREPATASVVPARQPAPAPVAKEVAASVMSDADAERYQAAHARASEVIGKHLGLKGYFLQMKLERCASLADLEELAPEIAEALAKAKSDALARRFLNEVRGLEAI